jgi:2-polyprenyl-6-methoxyphenol hydroxylase-like FAD-dependent oxidoreductase
MRALVIGAGIAGTATALALARTGVETTLCEAYDRDSEGIGAWLLLASNGVDAAATLGLGEAATAGGIATPRMRLVGHTGRTLAEFPFGTARADGLQVHSVRRPDLYRALRDAAAAGGVVVEYDKRLVAATGGPDGVRAEFADGSTAEADLLVGADGLRSRVRTIIDPQAPPARYVPLLNTGGYARGVRPGGRIDPRPGVMNFCFGRRCFLGYVVAPDGEVWWFANPPAPQEIDAARLAAIPDARWRAQLVELFERDRLPAAELVEASEHVHAGWNTYDFPTVPGWHRDRMVIIGDAAHAMAPSAGQGASMALEDAVVLAMALRDNPGVPEALAAYERQRRDRVERVVEYGRRNSEGKDLGPVGRLVRNRVIMPMVRARAARVGANPDRWLFDHHIEWNDRSTAGVSRPEPA